ncbi:MAG: hypothetical protein AAGE52_34830 [Myxococcota bacterium]
MAEDKPPNHKLIGARTMQIDAFTDSLEELSEDMQAKLGNAQVVDSPSLPPPLPPSKAPPAPSSAPPPAKRSPVIYVVGGLVAAGAAAAGIWLASTMLDDPAPAAPADDGVMEIGPIEVTTE